MNRNLLKQIWNERRSNAFLWMELFVVFVILWYIVDVVYVTLSIYNLPMGFDIENTYVLRFERMTSKAAAYQPGRTMKEDVADLHEIVNRLAHRPDVEAVSLSQNCIPYNDGANSFSFYLDTVPVRSLKRWITPEYFNVFRYRNIDGSGSESLAEALQIVSCRMILFRKKKFFAYYLNRLIYFRNVVGKYSCYIWKVMIMMLLLKNYRCQ